MRLFFALTILATLSACADTTADFEVNLVYGTGDSSAARELLINSLDSNGRFGITARVMYRYTGLNSFQVLPAQAAPPRCDGCDPNDPNISAISWGKASQPGFIISNNTVNVTGVPLGRRDLRIAIEFLQEFTAPLDLEAEVDCDANPELCITEYYVVAYGCFVPSTTGEVTESVLESAFRNGIQIFAGRTCGSCPIFEGDNDGIDAPDFTVANFNTPNTIPDACFPF